MILAGGLGVIAAGCGREPRTETAMADSARMADSLAMAPAPTPDGAAGARRSGAAVATENVVQVTEQVPGLLALAKILPIDAQHVAQTKFPTGTVKDGTIERRTGDLVYTFHIQDESGVVHAVLVDAMDGKLVTSIPKGSEKNPSP
jgi:hypothetical protein